MFTKILKWVGISVGIIIIGFFAFIGYVLTSLPNIEVPDIKVEVTPERIVRGQYLANNVMGCIDCHSKRKTDINSFPPDENSLGANAMPFDEKLGFTIGTLYPSNLTPFNLKNWSDGEIYRAVVNGVGKDNHVLFPIMPYKNYCKVDKEDIYSVIAYLRTLEPIETNDPKSEVSKFPLPIIMRLFFPEEAQHNPIPDMNDKVKYGEYLVTAASCGDCHTPMDGGQPVLDSAFAGGFEMISLTGKKIQSPNITPDEETGIGKWSEDYFVGRFAEYRDSSKSNQKIGPDDFHTEMPWVTYSGMKDEDLRAIFAYLKSIKPIKKLVKRGNY
jgi:hypothetical protein